MLNYKVIIFVLLYSKISAEENVKNNVCKDWDSYYIKDISPNCYHDPDVYAEVPEVLDRHLGKGHYENYTVTTEDGYILTMFRLVQKNPKGVIMLQHFVFGDGIAYLSQGNESFALKLWTLGYEVWLPNHRGTYYSDQHTSLTVNDLKYWDFSFEEIGLKDYPLFAEKISEVSNNTEIIFIGHSMACTSSIIYASVMPEHAQRYFKVFMQMAAPVYFKYVPAPGKYLIPLEPVLKPIFKALNIGGLFYRNSLTKTLQTQFIETFPFKKLVVKIVALFSGWTPDEFDPRMYILVLSRLLRGTSVNIVWHYLQIASEGGDNFRRFDHGTTENINRYNSTIPPKYPLENMQIPTYFLTSDDDSLCGIKDNDLLWSRLSNATKIYGRQKTKGLNHTDFFFGKHAYEYAFNYIIELLNKL